jgi:hypothetical protein
VAHLRPFVVGDKTYRGDSWICPSAIHAGVISARSGGSVVIVPKFNDPPSMTFRGVEMNGIHSMEFNGSYPLTFEFKPVLSAKFCEDNVIPASIYFYSLLPLLLLGDPSLYHWFMANAGYFFFFIVFLSVDSQKSDSFVSSAFGQVIPFGACAHLIAMYIVPRVLPATPLAYSFDLIVFFYIPTVLLLFIELFQSFLPPITLSSAIFASPSQFSFFLLLIILLGFCALMQLNILRKSGMLISLAKWYLPCCAVFFLVFPALDFSPHIHHYFVGLTLMPFVRTPTHFSMACFGALWGMFIHGVARWGMDSPVSTQLEIQQGLGLLLGSQLPVWNSTVLFSEIGVQLNWKLPLKNSTLGNLTDLLGEPEKATRAGISYFSLYANDIEVSQTFVSQHEFQFSTTSRLGMLPWNDPMAFRVVPRRSGTFMDSSPTMLVWRNGTTKVMPKWTPP